MLYLIVGLGVEDSWVLTELPERASPVMATLAAQFLLREEQSFCIPWKHRLWHDPSRT